MLDPSRYRAEILSGPQTGPEGDLLSVAKSCIPTTVVDSLVREIRPWKDLAAYRRILEHLRNPPAPEHGRYTIVHTHVSKAGILARLAARRAGTPIIVHTAHGWQWTHRTRGALNRFMIACERRVARFTDRIIVVSELDREKGLEAGVGTPGQYVLIESAVPMEDFDPARADGAAARAELGIPPGAPVAGTVNRFAYPKEPRLMMEAVQRILHARPDAFFVFVGDGPLRERTLSAFAELDGHPRLRLLGVRKDVPRLVAAMDVFLLSSKLEGMPRAVVEALALGKPVVSTPAGGVEEVVTTGETGFIVPHGDAEALAGKVLELLANPDRARTLGAEGSRRVRRRFDVGFMVQRIAALYEELLAERASAGMIVG